MTRYLLPLVTLALVLAGCPSSPSTDTDAGGGGGTDAPADMTDTGVPETDTGVPETDSGVPETDAPVAAGGTCTNAADMAALETMGDALEAATGDCAMMCVSQPAAMRRSCINACIQDPSRINGAITSACTDCFAGAAACTIAGCLLMCIDPDSTGCVNCQCSMCAPAFTTCSGLPDTRC